MIVDDIVVPIEVGLIKLSRNTADGPGHQGRAKNLRAGALGEAVVEAVEILQNIVKPDRDNSGRQRAVR